MLQDAETDCAVWVSPEALSFVVSPETIGYFNGPQDEDVTPNLPGKLTQLPQSEPQIDVLCLCGIYPNRVKQGIAQGHLCMLHKFAMLQVPENMNTGKKCEIGL